MAATLSISDRISTAFGNGRLVALREWRAAVKAAVVDGVEPNVADLERLAFSFGITVESIGDEFAGDCRAFDAVTRLEAGAVAADREYAALCKKVGGEAEALRSKAEALRSQAEEIERQASTLEGLRTAAGVERLQARSLRQKTPRVFDSPA